MFETITLILKQYIFAKSIKKTTIIINFFQQKYFIYVYIFRTKLHWRLKRFDRLNLKMLKWSTYRLLLLLLLFYLPVKVYDIYIYTS